MLQSILFCHLILLFVFSVQGVLQTYKVISDFAGPERKLPELFLVVSIISSMSSVSVVLMMFFEGQATKNAKWYYKAGLFVYHFLEVALRTAIFVLFGHALGGHSFIAVPFVILSRFLVKFATKDSAPFGLVLASVFLDSAYNDLQAFRVGSLASLAEGVIVVLLAAVPEGSLKHRPEIATVVWAMFLACIFVKCVLHFSVMERHSKFKVGKNKTTTLEHEQDVQEELEDVVPESALEDALEKVLRVAGDIA